MKNEIKQDYRAAVAVLQSLQKVHDAQSSTPLTDSFAMCQRWQRRLELSSSRNWETATNDAAERLRGALDVHRMRVTQAIDDLLRQSRTRIQPTAKLIFQEIEALRGEFESVTIDRANQRLSVETSSITLEGVYLGSFEIRLNWKYIKNSSPFDVYAVDPNYPATGDGVTHPHIQSDSLCEGEGSDAIRRALDEGRLYDFFCVVDHILRNYNPDSAYVQLDDWNGINCRACGDTVNSDEVVGCCKCETELCLDCSTCCDSCCDRYCEECVSSCENCGDDVCKTCLKSCDDCGENSCSTCLFEGTCDDCINKQNEEYAETETQSSSAKVQSLRDGKVAVPA